MIEEAVTNGDFLGIIVSYKKDLLESEVSEDLLELKSKTELRFKNGARILVKNPAASEIRGYHADKIRLETEVSDELLYEVLKPCVAAKEGEVVKCN